MENNNEQNNIQNEVETLETPVTDVPQTNVENKIEEIAPQVETPAVEVASNVEVPQATVSEVQTPNVEVPQVAVSEVQAPSVEVPQVAVAEVQAPTQEVETLTESAENTIEIVGEDAKQVEANGTINVDSKMNVNTGKSKTTMIIAIAAVVVVLIVAGLFAFRSLFLLNKKTIVKGQVETFFNILNSGVEAVEDNVMPIDFANDSVGFEGKVNFSSNFKGDVSLYEVDLTNLEKYNVTYSGVIDVKNNKLSFDGNINKENEKLLSAAIYFADKVGVLKSEQLYDGLLKTDADIDLKELHLDNTINYNDIKKLINKTGEIVKSLIDEDQIVKEDATIDVDGKETKVIKVTYKYDFNDLLVKIAKAYKEDKEAMELLTKITNSTEEEVKSSLDEVNTSDNEKAYLVVSSYSDTMLGSVKQIDVTYETENSKDSNTFVFTKVEGKNAWNYKLKDSKDIRIYGEINSDTKTKTFNAESDSTKMNISLVTEKNKTTIDFKMEYDGYKFGVKFVNDTTMSDSFQESKMTIEATAEVEGKNYYFNVNSEFKLIKGASLKELSASSAKNIDDLDYYEKNILYTKLTNIMDKIFSDFYKVNSKYSYYSSYGSYGSYDSYSSYDSYNYDNYSTSNSDVLSM